MFANRRVAAPAPHAKGARPEQPEMPAAHLYARDPIDQVQPGDMSRPEGDSDVIYPPHRKRRFPAGLAPRFRFSSGFQKPSGVGDQPAPTSQQVEKRKKSAPTPAVGWDRK